MPTDSPAGPPAAPTHSGADITPELQSLEGFDLVYAISPDTINSQFQLLYAIGILPTRWHASVQDGLYAVDARLGAPTVCFGAAEVATRTVEMNVPLHSGTLNYAKVAMGGDGKPKVERQTADLSGSTLAIRTTLNLTDVASRYETSSAVPQAVKDQLQHFDPRQFDLRSLYLDLEDANLVTGCTLEMKSPDVTKNQPEVVAHISALIGVLLDSLRGSDNPYVFGYAVTDQREPTPGATWVPTGVTYSLLAGSAAPAQSSVNYLLETGHKPIPGPDAGDFRHPWISAPGVQGTFVVSEALVMRPLLAAIAGGLGRDPSEFVCEQSGGLRGYSLSFANDVRGATRCRVAITPETNVVEVTTSVAFKKEMHDAAHHHIGHVDGTISWHTRITYSLNSELGTIEVSSCNSAPAISKSDHPNALGRFEKGLAVFADFVVRIVTFDQVNRVFQHLVSQDWRLSLGSDLSASLTQTRARIVMPAGSQITFKDVRFDSGNALLLTTTVEE